MTVNSIKTNVGLAVGWVRDAVNGRIYNQKFLTDDFIVGSNQITDAGGTDRDNRMYYQKSSGAFRAGRASTTQWDSPGAYSAAFGNGNIASGSSSLATGALTTASGGQSFSAGDTTTASGTTSVSLGVWTTSSAYGTIAHGLGAVASRHAQRAQGTYYQVAGRYQSNQFIAGLITTNATASPVLFDAGEFAAGAVALTGENTNVLTVPASKGHNFKIRAIARRTDVEGDFASWTVIGSIVRSSTGNARFISTPTVTADKDAGASTWDLAVSVNTTNATNNYLAITVTGEASKTIRWSVNIDTTEVG